MLNEKMVIEAEEVGIVLVGGADVFEEGIVGVACG